MKESQKLFESFKTNLNESNNKTYYHYDNATYEVGSIITKQYNYTYKEIIDIYKEIVGIDVSNIVYMLDHPDNNYEDGTYKYRYGVEPLDKIVCGNSDYSPIMCDLFLKDNTYNYNLEDKEVLKNIILTFARAYIGSKDDLEILSNIFTTFSDKKEYITNKCKVKSFEEII